MLSTPLRITNRWRQFFRDKGWYMIQPKVGQKLAFIELVRVDVTTINPRTRVRVGFVLNEVTDPQVTVVMLEKEPRESLTVPRHVLTMRCVSAGEDS